MPTEVIVRVQSLTDAENDYPVFEEDPTLIIQKEQMIVGIMEAGTQGQQNVVAFLLKNDTDGTSLVAQITARQMEALYSLFKGAEQRFQDEKAMKN